MPSLIKLPDHEALIAESPIGARLYANDINPECPLYRGIKLITDNACIPPRRRTAHLVWICHEARLRRGGDSWRLHQNAPDLLAWIEATLRAEFGFDYMLSQFDTLADCQAAVEAERAKYTPKK